MPKSKIQIPKNQIAKETLCDINHMPRFIITQDKTGEYILYEIKDNKPIKIKQNKIPIPLSEFANKQIEKG